MRDLKERIQIRIVSTINGSDSLLD